MIKLLHPTEVDDKHLENIPDSIIEAVNDLIVQKWNGYQSIVRVKDIKGIVGDNVNIGSLGIDRLYKRVGWKVVYDRPGYNETYEANFVFSKG